MKITAKAPCRVDLAGGTIDIWPLYLYHPKAVTVNFAVDRYASCVLETRPGRRIVVRSRDLNAEESFDSIDALRGARKYRLPLAAFVIRYFAPRGGFELVTNSEAPAGAGIAGSSTLIIALASTLNKLTGAGYAIEKIREISQNVEAQIIRVPTGCQDYYPAMYGGVSAIELTEAGIARKAVPVDLEEINERIVLAYTGEPRNSGINNWEVMKAHIDGSKKVFRNFERIAEIAHDMRGALGKADWKEVARLLREEWSFRRKNAPGITTPLIDRLVAVTRRAGAAGAKACGAGGGGCVIFLVERGAKARVAAAIEREGAEVLPVRVAPRGVVVKVEKEAAGRAMPARRDPLRLALQVIVYAFLYAATARLFGPLFAWLGEYLTGITVTVLVAACFANWLALRIFEGRSIADAGLYWNTDSMGNLGLGVAGGAGSAAVVLTGALAAGAARMAPVSGAATSFRTIAFVTVLLFFGAAGEEILFRGYGFQRLLAVLGPAATILPVGVLFALLHAANPNATALGLVNTAGFGILFGYAFLRSRDLWLPIGLHFGWNVTLPLFGVQVSGLRIGMTGYAMEWTAGPLWSGGDYGPEASILTSAVLFGLFVYLRRAPVRRQRSILLDPPGGTAPCEAGPQPPSSSP